MSVPNQPRSPKATRRPGGIRRYLLHKRDKGEPGTDLKSLVYVRLIQLGPKALEEGKRKAAGGTGKPESKKPSGSTKKGRT